jgi:tetratricopeptide (TPR) repeat protein
VVLAVLVGGLALPAGETTETVRLAQAAPAAEPTLRLAQAAPAEQPALLEQLAQASADGRRTAAERLGEIGDAAAADGLARALHDPDAGVREAAAASLWAVWMRSGDPTVDVILQQGITRMGEGRFSDAVGAFSEVIRRAPRFAEGWNKRATVYYLMGELDRSLADCEEVIRLNPVHFGALSGFGLIYLQKDDLPHAAEYFERALAVNPDLGRVRAALEEIRAVLAERRRQSI